MPDGLFGSAEFLNQINHGVKVLLTGFTLTQGVFKN